MFCTPRYTSRRPLNAFVTAVNELPGGNMLTVGLSAGEWRAANSAMKSRAARGLLFIFQLPAITGFVQLMPPLRHRGWPPPEVSCLRETPATRHRQSRRG